MNLTADNFAEFFHAIHGYDPFPWQHDLAAKVCSPDSDTRGLWPTCLALPTGSGKTSCVDIALFALACQTDVSDSQRTAPRRIIFVVDRRVIVDEAFEHSLNLAKKLRDAKDGILFEVATRLRTLAGGEALQKLLPQQMLSNTGDLLPLTCHQLRGGVYRDDAWARTPLQPCVIASTVDQIGSRLLFRGYGCSFKSWPLHAGLAATDSLVILDEAHCAQPFMETLQSVQRFRGRAKEQVGGPFQFAIMSATPPEGVGEASVHRISDADLKNKVLGKRIRTPKPARLMPSKAKGAFAQRDLAEDLAQHAASLIDEQHQAIAILVNRVPTAKYCHMLLDAVRDPTKVGPYKAATINALRKLLPEDFDVVLMTGRMRSVDKAAISEDWLKRLNANSVGERSLDRPVIVVATQCLEVGANLDFDAMVSECASLDALRQRFGRLNRTARDIPACGIITIRADQVSVKNEDPIYGETLANTWELLTTNANDETIDFGIEPMNALWKSLDADQLRAVIPESKHAAVMLPAHLDVLCQTSPAPIPSPAPAVFLHGLDDGRPEIQVCWRADLTDHTGQARPAVARRLINAVSMTPPTSMECMSVPLAVFRRWLTSKSTADVRDAASEIADTSTGTPEANDDRWVPQHAAVIWRGKDSRVIGEAFNDAKKTVVVPLRELRPGDTVVLPVSAGGYHVFGHVPNVTAPIDVADRCYLESRQRASIRLHPATLDAIHWDLDQPLSTGEDIPAEKRSEAQTSVEELRRILYTTEEEPDKAAIKELLLIISGAFDKSDWLRSAVLSDPFGRRTLLKTVHITEEGTLRPTWQIGLRGSKRVYGNNEDLELTRGDSFTGDDEVNSNTVPVTLMEHTNGVRDFAQVFAEYSGLSGFAAAYAQVAALHDLGKTDLRFQAFLFGGDRLCASLNSHTPMAKSAGLNDVQAEYKRAQTLSGMPVGFRHELLSLQLATEVELLTADDDQRDLILHLLATHHGYCRPFAPVVHDPAAESLDLSWNNSLSGNLPDDSVIGPDERRRWTAPHQIDSGIAERFWRLVDRYGWWGLAWLESVFVLADRRRSESEQYFDSSETQSQQTQQQELTL